MKKSILRQGFTLIELLVVIAVIGILVTGLITIINPSAQFAKIRNAARKSDLRQLNDAIKRYNLAKGSYPTTNNVWCGATGSGYTVDTTNCPVVSGAVDWIPGLKASNEIDKLPQDPQFPKAITGCGIVAYAYKSNATATEYKIIAHCGPEGTAADVAADSMVDSVDNKSWSISSPGGTNL